MAVQLGAAGLFLSLSPIRDHRAYHDGSVYIYQQNTGQKTQTCLCVQQSTPVNLKGDCEDIICCIKCVLYGIEQPLPRDCKVHRKHTVASYVLVELTLITLFYQVTE